MNRWTPAVSVLALCLGLVLVVGSRPAPPSAVLPPAVAAVTTTPAPTSTLSPIEPTATPVPVKLTKKATEMLRADLKYENDTIRAYRERVLQCEALGEFAIAEDIREILRQEQEHQIDLATALGEEAPDLSRR